MSDKKELRTAKRNLRDLRKRKEGAIDGDVMELLDNLMTADEIEESDIQATLIGGIVCERNERQRRVVGLPANKKDGH